MPPRFREPRASRAPNHAIGEVELALDMDLTDSDAWRQIVAGLGAEVGGYGKILAPSMERPVSGRGDTGRRITSKNKPGTTRLVSGQPQPRKRTGTGRTTCGVLLDDNRRWTICRLRFNAKTVKYLELIEEGRGNLGTRNTSLHRIDSLDDIFGYADHLRATVTGYLSEQGH